MEAAHRVVAVGAPLACSLVRLYAGLLHNPITPHFEAQRLRAVNKHLRPMKAQTSEEKMYMQAVRSSRQLSTEVRLRAHIHARRQTFEPSLN